MLKNCFIELRNVQENPFGFGHFVSSHLSEQEVYLNEKVVRGTQSIEVAERLAQSGVEGSRSAAVFAFPGNPISTFVSCLKYFVPWFQKSMKLDFNNRNFAVLSEDVTFKPAMTYFLQVKLENVNGQIMAIPFRGNGSGDLASLVETDAFIELPANQTEFKKGTVFAYLNYRNK